eukprot:TRINITY_DN45183_c0_g1_i1.p1 TRINITY_DN45183_c0_g1~~TRINITY_DN45183_c0_g1_i1.p1  ORF type:complete len:345 (+),score=56.22 TRINITY_DN45183_c0_g1_i1:131-1165(+)
MAVDLQLPSTPSAPKRPMSASPRRRPMPCYPKPRTDSVGAGGSSRGATWLPTPTSQSVLPENSFGLEANDVGSIAPAEFVPSASADMQSGSVNMQKHLRGLAHRVNLPGGLAGALLTSMGGFVPGGLVEHRMLQSAIMALAPRPFLVPCTSTGCCWRWAAQTLLDEYSVVRAEANTARAVLVDELGGSVRQQLIDLQERHASTSLKMETTCKEVEMLKRSRETLEKKLAKCEGELRESNRQVVELNSTNQRLMREHTQFEDRTSQVLLDLRRKLEESKHAREQVAELWQRAEESESRTADLKDSNEVLNQKITVLHAERDKLCSQLRHWEELSARSKNRRPRHK